MDRFDWHACQRLPVCLGRIGDHYLYHYLFQKRFRRFCSEFYMVPRFWFYVAAGRLFWDQLVYSELLTDLRLCLSL